MALGANFNVRKTMVIAAKSLMRRNSANHGAVDDSKMGAIRAVSVSFNDYV